jgi:hypothetical protein
VCCCGKERTTVVTTTTIKCKLLCRVFSGTETPLRRALSLFLTLAPEEETAVKGKRRSSVRYDVVTVGMVSFGDESHVALRHYGQKGENKQRRKLEPTGIMHFTKRKRQGSPNKPGSVWICRAVGAYMCVLAKE